MNKMERNLDEMSTAGILKLINNEDSKIHKAVKKCLPEIEKAVSIIVSSLKNNGTLYYIGAGTSGRLGVLDSSEIWPTFGSKHVKAIIAGGEKAVTGSVEGAEDDIKNARKVILKNVKKGDVVLGIAASGNTPFTAEALEEARRIGCKTIGLVCNRNTKIKKIADLCIEAVVGDEIIKGSTRMKAGTATKLILNQISTATMIKLGKVYGNLMIDIQPTNAKLKKRAVSILEKITGIENEKVLEEAGWNIKVAAVMINKKVSKNKAVEILEKNYWDLRSTIS